MSNDELKDQVLEILGMKNVPEDMQQEALYRVESIANKRLALAIPDLLSEEQQQHVNNMYDEEKSDDEIVEWVYHQIPEFDDVMRAVMLDVADEVADDAKL